MGGNRSELDKEQPMKPFRFFMIPPTLALLTLLLVACAPVAAQPTPTAFAENSLLTWSRSGGFAGFCDKIVIHPSYDVTVTNCKSDVEVTFTLTESQRVQLDVWLETYQPIEYHRTDPATADAMTITLSLAGNGAQLADEQTIGLISQFASELAFQALP